MVSSAGDVFSKRLPHPVRDAQRRSQQLPEVHAIPNGVLLVGALLSFTNLEDVKRPLRFARERLAQILNCSERTIDRRLAALEDCNLAERVTPKGRCRGRWPVCQVQWTDKALTTFWPDGVLPRSMGSATGQLPPSPAPVVSHRSRGKTNYESKESGGAGLGHGPNRKGNPSAGLPADLRYLVEQRGLRRVQVVTLMSLCKRRGQRLQDLTAAVLTSATDAGDRLMGFLLHCANLDRDWGSVLRRRAQEAYAQTRQTVRQRNLERLAGAVTVGQEVPGLGTVVERRADVLVVEAAGVRRVAMPAVVAASLVENGGWRAVRAVRRGRALAGPPPMVRAEPTSRVLGSEARAALHASLQLLRRRGLGLEVGV